MQTTSTSPVALITGASHRIGNAIASSLHKKGFAVIVHYHHSHSDAERLCEAFNNERADSAVAIHADLTSVKDVEALATTGLKQWGRIDALINNASVFNREPDDANIDAEHWQQAMDVNVRAAYQLSAQLQGALKKQQGNIINLVDIYAERPLKSHTSYNVSKAANAMLIKSLALEFSPSIRVNGISPGAILWPEIHNDSVQNIKEQQNELLQKIPLSRLGSVDAITQTVHYLLNCNYITGQIINVDGGRSITI